MLRKILKQVMCSSFTCPDAHMLKLGHKRPSSPLSGSRETLSVLMPNRQLTLQPNASKKVLQNDFGTPNSACKILSTQERCKKDATIKQTDHSPKKLKTPSGFSQIRKIQVFISKKGKPPIYRSSPDILRAKVDLPQWQMQGTHVLEQFPQVAFANHRGTFEGPDLQAKNNLRSCLHFIEDEMSSIFHLEKTQKPTGQSPVLH